MHPCAPHTHHPPPQPHATPPSWTGKTYTAARARTLPASSLRQGLPHTPTPQARTRDVAVGCRPLPRCAHLCRARPGQQRQGPVADPREQIHHGLAGGGQAAHAPALRVVACTAREQSGQEARRRHVKLNPPASARAAAAASARRAVVNSDPSRRPAAKGVRHSLRRWRCGCGGPQGVCMAVAQSAGARLPCRRSAGEAGGGGWRAPAENMQRVTSST